MQMKDFRRGRQLECKKGMPKRLAEIMGGRHPFSATTVNINQSRTELRAFLKSQQTCLSQGPPSTMAVSGTQILPGWLLNRPAAYVLQEPCSGTNDSFTLPSPLSRSKFMVALDTLINVHSQLALSVAIQSFPILCCMKRWIFSSPQRSCQ